MGRDKNEDPGDKQSDAELDDLARELGADDAEDLRKKLDDK